MPGFYMKRNTGLKWIKRIQYINLVFFSTNFEPVIGC